MSSSNRMFYEKAVSAWRDGSDYSRTQLVVQYFQCVVGFTQPEVIKQVLPIISAPAEESQQLQQKGSLFAYISKERRGSPCPSRLRSFRSKTKHQDVTKMTTSEVRNKNAKVFIY